MKKFAANLIIGLLATGLSSLAMAAAGTAHLEHSEVNVRDLAAVQSGAKWYVNYCMSCHSAQYMRYNRLSEDLNLTEEQVMNNLVFSDAKIGETMDIAMRPADATKWLGKAPPDLSLISRSRGNDWLFTYLKSFYQDETGGWNNLVLPNASMPHVMWQLQGIQKPVYATQGDAEVVDHLVLASEGLQTPEEYETTVRELVTFLDYLSEPAKLKRKSIGIWVMLFLTLFAFVAYLLKAEYWRDIH
ncbi:MAG TPA: cytochrome c1 [Xanthomonadales bacterium]|nr:cytochrome c1 [Xanthomonadales bacterium]